MSTSATSLNLASILDHHARMRPATAAVVMGDRRLTYAQLNAMAGKIAMDGCRHGRLCMVHAMHSAALANSGPDDSDNDTHREWRRCAKPAAARLVAIAEQAYRAA